MGSWIHDGFLDSRLVPEFTMGSWSLDGFMDPSFDSATSVVLRAQSEVKNKKLIRSLAVTVVFHSSRKGRLDSALDKGFHALA